jgi:hypothetical protein
MSDHATTSTALEVKSDRRPAASPSFGEPDDPDHPDTTVAEFGIVGP